MSATGLDPLSEERIARNDALFRDANEGIEAEALELGWDDEDRIPFVCECADRGCREFLRLTLPEYEEIRARPRTFLNAPGHQVAAKGAAVVVAENDRYFVVEKIGHAGEVAERLDPREDKEAGGRRAVS
jgi:hypothetical protein